MKIGELFERVIPVLEKAQVPYMVTGSVASSVHGKSRSTNDVDIVIAPSPDQLQQIVSELQALNFYADQMQTSLALKERSQFNAIDNVSTWKIDFIFAEQTDYGRTALSRREAIVLDDQTVQVVTAEDVLIAKLRWAKLGGSERQIEDAAGILRVREKDLDTAYVEKWVRELQLEDQWSAVQKLGAP